MYDSQEYEETNIDDIIIVSSRLEIPGKFFEIGVIKSTKETDMGFIKETAAKKGADIIIVEGNLNYTLARYKYSKNGEEDETNSIKTYELYYL